MSTFPGNDRWERSPNAPGPIPNDPEIVAARQDVERLKKEAENNGGKPGPSVPVEQLSTDFTPSSN